MTRSFLLSPLLRLPLLLLGIVVFVGCTTVPDPEPPNLSSARQSTELRMQSLLAMERTIEEELLRLDELYDSFKGVIAHVEKSTLPLGLLRLVVMNCLNTEYGDGLSEVVGIEGVPLSCRPMHLERLEQSLETVSLQERDNAIQLLYLIDQVRILRGALRQRLARLPATVADHREFIVEERAALRQLEADLARRRTLYSAEGWREVTALVAEHRRLLRDFSDSLDEIAERYPQWPARLDTTVSTIYFDLSEMRLTTQ